MQAIAEAWRVFPQSAWDLIGRPASAPSLALARKNTAMLQRSISDTTELTRSNTTTATATATGAALDSVRVGRIDAIVGMGFTKSEAERALAHTKDDIDQAVDALLNGTIPVQVKGSLEL